MGYPNWFKHSYKNGRRGPLGRDTSFTTIIIVSRRINASISSVGVECDEKNVFRYEEWLWVGSMYIYL